MTQLVKILFQSRRLNTKIITGGITVKACYGISKQCADNVHFTNAAKPDLQILFIVKKFTNVNELMTSPNSHSTEILKAFIASL